jgi:hypothetical protein
MWQMQAFTGNDQESALRSLVDFVNTLGLEKDQFEVIACPEHSGRAVLLYQEPEKAAYKDYQSMCQADVLSDQWP